ncbi:YheC/YheD family protein [Lysinibacillus sphaericus]
MFIKKRKIKSGTIMIHPASAGRLNMREGPAVVHMGIWQKKVSVSIDKGADKGSLLVPPDLFPFTIPEDLEFEWRSDGQHLHAGPVLGIVRGVRMSNINKRSLKILNRWVKSYNDIKGLVIVFPLSEVERGATTTNGFCFHPGSKGGQWMEGSFPFPDAVFNRPIAGTGKKYHILDDLTGGRFFNSRGTGKWEFYQALKRNPEAEKLIPYSEKFSDFDRLFSLLETYCVLYLKKRFGARGYGIIQIKKEGKQIIVTRVVRGMQVKERFQTNEECTCSLGKIVKKNRYIVQQGVPFETERKHVDFRGYIQKDSSMEWKLRGFIGRLAKPESVITNIRYTEQILPGKDALREFYGYDEAQAEQAASQIHAACIKAGESLDLNIGHFGDVALDFIVDQQGDIYFLEANSNYGHESFMKIKDLKLRDRVLRSPLEYAKALAGFGLRKGE